MRKSATLSTIAWMDWSGIERNDFVAITLDRLERQVERAAIGLKFWKDLGLSIRDRHGALLSVDDERLAPIFDKAAELGIPVMFHTADPAAFFLPIDSANERYEELAAHPDWSFFGSQRSKRELLDQRDRVFSRHPDTTFVAAHVAESGEDLGRVASMLEIHPNVKGFYLGAKPRKRSTQIVKLYVLKDVAFLQSLIDGAGIWAVNERSARVQPVVHPILIPAGRGLNKFLNIARSRAIQCFDFQAAIDADIDIGLDHGNNRRRLPGLGNAIGLAHKEIDFVAVPGRAPVQHLDRSFHRIGRIACFPLFGLLDIVDFINDAVDSCPGLCYCS